MMSFQWPMRGMLSGRSWGHLFHPVSFRDTHNRTDWAKQKKQSGYGLPYVAWLYSKPDMHNFKVILGKIKSQLE